jgi:cytochrome c oxidase subunit 3
MAGHTESVSKAELWDGGGSPFRVSYGKLMMWLFLVSDALSFGGLLIAYGFFRHRYPDWPVGEKVFNAMPFLGDGFPLLYVALMTFILIVSSVTMVLAVEAGHRLDKQGVIKWLTLTVIGGFFFVGSQAWEWYHFIHGSGGVITTTSGEVYNVKIENDNHSLVRNADGRYSIEDQKNSLHEGGELLLMQNRYGEGEIINIDESEYEAIFADMADYYTGASMLRNEYAATSNVSEQAYVQAAPQFGNAFFFITGFHGFHVFSGVIINLIILMQVVKGKFDNLGHYEMVEKTGLYWHFVDLVWVFVFTFFYLV